MNYTQPDNPDYEDSPKDWLKCSIVFSIALGYLLPENEGVIVDVQNDVAKYFPNYKKLVVYRQDNHICIGECTEDAPAGTPVRIDT